MTRCTALAAITLCLLLPLWVLAQDADSDGLPDAVEEQLGSDPRSAETFDLLVKDKTKDEGDRVGADNYAPGLDMTGASLANAGQDRWIWRVDFLEEPVIANLGLIIYIHADNDPSTGRRDIRGVDYMILGGAHGSAVRSFGADGAEKPLSARSAVLGKSLYLSADLNLLQEAGRTKCSANVLAETREPYKMVDTIDAFPISAQGMSERPKPFMIGDATRSEGLLVTWGLDLMRALQTDGRNVRLKIEDCRTHGFKLDIFTQYHMPSVRVQEGAPYTIEATAPRDGAFYPAFIVYDDYGRQVYTLSLNGERIGIAVASVDNRRQALFVADKPIQVKQGDVLKVELAHSEGTPRVEDLWLLGELPEIRKVKYEIRNLNVDLEHGRITFITTWPVKALLEHGTTEQYAWKIEDREPESNHRWMLSTARPPGDPFCYRLTCMTPEGETLVRTGSIPGFTPASRPALERARSTVALTVRNPHDVALTDWPITQGIPIPQGELERRINLPLRLLDPDGNAIPVQAQDLAVWPDGSIKWLLLDFQVTIPAGEEQVYNLEYGMSVESGPFPEAPVRFRPADLPTRICDNGVLRLEFSNDASGALAGIWFDRNGNGEYEPDERVAGGDYPVGSEVTVGGETAGIDAKPIPVRGPRGVAARGVQRILAGPLHAAYRVTRDITMPGSGATFLDEYEYHIYAGKPFIRVFHTWTNSNAKSEWSDIQSWDLVNTLNLGDALVATSNGVTVDEDEIRSGFSLDQPFDNAFALTAGNETLKQGERAGGWLDLSGADAGVTVAMRDFWQQYPKRLTAGVDEQGHPQITVGIMPEFAPGTYKISKEGELEDKLFYYLKDDVYHLRQGVSKRHEMLYCFRPGNAELDLAPITAFQRPPVAVAPKEWYADSKALTDFLPSSPELGGIYRAYDDSTQKSLAAYLKSRETGREYGMLNFGDWWGERGRNWGNIEYDTQHGFYLQFVRSGDPEFLYAAEEACRHNMDVDTVRVHSNPDRVGGVYAHCIGHTGNYYGHMINDQGSPGGGFTVTHTWVEGYLDDYFLTGDLRGLETARLVADHYDSAYMRNYDYDDNRTSGWHLILTLAMYRATGDPYYLNAAHIIIERVKEREMPEGGWARQLMPGHCHCLPRHRGEAAFMTGVLLTGLKDYHEITGDPVTADMIVRGSKNIIRATWVPERNGMRYTSCPNTGPSTGLSTLVTEGILYAYGLSGDPEIGEVALAGTLQAGTIVSGNGKGLSQQIRVTPHFLHQLKDTGLADTALVLSGEPVTAFVRPRPSVPFEIVLRAKDGVGAARAVLTAPDGTVLKDLALDPASGSVTLISGTAPQQGTYRLELSGTGVWGIDPYLNPLVIRADKPVTLAPQPSPRAYFVAPGAKLTCAAASGPIVTGDTFVAPPEFARPLGYYTVPASTPATVTVSGNSTVFAPWAQFWFDPGQPTAKAKVGWQSVPGKGLVLSLDASGSTDADGKVVRAEWSIGGTPVGEGMSAHVTVSEPGTHQVRLVVTDDAGLQAMDAAHFRVPPEWLMNADPARTVTIEAEDFIAQSGGEVQLHERFSSGKMLTYWHGNLGHALTWEAQVPADGDYIAALKYCTDTERTRRDFRIDGEPPVPGLAAFDLPSTGGFSTAQDNWEYLRLGEWTGTPFVFHLARGRHEISMSNLGDGCGLDQLFLIPAQ